MKIACLILHCLNLVAAAAIASNYHEQWIGFALLTTGSLDIYLTSQIPKAP